MGVWTRAQALAVLSRDAIDWLVASRQWQVVFRGVYADGGYVLSAQQRAFAVVLAGNRRRPEPPNPPGLPGPAGRPVPPAVACGRTAARVWGLPLIDDDDPTTAALGHLVDDVHSDRSRRAARPPARLGEPRRRELRYHRLDLGPGEIAELPNGLRLTSPLRTALDCVPLLGHQAGVCALDAGLHLELFTPADLERALAQRRGTPHAAAQARAVAAADGRAEAPSETLARLVLLPVLPGLVPQVELRDRGRVIARFDLGDPETRLALEVDGKRGHAGAAMVAQDQRRDRRTEAQGWRTERTTWFEVRRRPEDLRARMLTQDRLRRNVSA